jgi:predicted Zn-dependent protease
MYRVVRYITITSLTVLFFFLLFGCTTQPQPGYSAREESILGERETHQILANATLYRDPKLNRLVKKVTQRIARVSGRKDFKWQSYIIDDPKTANAFVLPGGKVFIYTGIFRYIANEDELAAVIAHEAAHALRSDGIVSAERKQTTAVIGTLLKLGLHAAKVDPNIVSAADTLYSAGSKFGYLHPFSRRQETAADAMGLMLMAKAGYDPRAAVTFWKKFAKAGSYIPEYFSTHPDPKHRIKELERLLPEALKLY